MKENLKRYIGLLLAFIMVFSMVPVSAFADAFASNVIGPLRPEEAEKHLTADYVSREDIYRVTMAYTADAMIPDNAELRVSEILPGTPAFDAYVAESAGALGWEEGSVSDAMVFDISIFSDGAEIQPAAPVSMEIVLLDRSAEDWNVVHFGREETQVLESTASGDAVSFETDGFSVFVFAKSKIEKTLVASDGNTYKITLTYDSNKAGIPEDAELMVTEILQQVVDDASVTSEYDEYLSKAEGALEENRRVTFARFFDITILADGQEIQPAVPVEVKIELANSELDADESEDVKAVHFSSDGEVTALDTTHNFQAVTFSADGFSVYGIVVTETISTQFKASDDNTYEVTVNYDENAGIPQGAKLEVSEVKETDSGYEKYRKQSADAINSRVIDLNYIKLLDIRIVDGNGDPVTLHAPVDVRIRLLDKEQADDTTQVVHFEGTEETPVLLESDFNGDTVAFVTDGFSVYAVVGDGSDADEARATVNFYGKDTGTPVATVFVKNSDTAEELEEIVYDPGCGELDSTKKELFDGWIISTVNTTDGSSYTLETEGKTIEDVRDYLESLEITEGDVINIYAKVVRTLTVSYVGEVENVLLGSSIVKVIGSDDPESEANIGEYTISMNYTPATSTQAFMGWNVVEGATNIVSATYDEEAAESPYMNGTQIRIKGDVKLSVNAPYGHWLVFDENGKGATYNAPSFIKDGETSSVPSLEMVRLGYAFGGWYKLKDGVDISNVAKDETSGSYIISDAQFESFTFEEELSDNITIYAKWDPAPAANYTVVVWKERMSDTYAVNGGTGEGKQKYYDFAESYTFSGTVGTVAGAVSNGTSSVVDGDDSGTRYYNARIQGTAAGGTNVNKTIAYTGYHCAGYDTDVTIAPEGTSVINVYYDRNTVTYTFYTYGSSGTDGTWWLCKENGDQIIQSGRTANYNTGIATRSGNDYTQYTGRVAYGDGQTYYYSTSGTCGGTYMREAHWENVSGSGSTWNVYQKSTGLYGETLNWPTDTSIWWYEDHNNTRGTGTRMTYKSAFLPLDDDMTVEYWGSTASASGTIHFWTQNVNGGTTDTDYTDRYQVATGNANFNINDKFTGFYAYQYRADNGTWQNVGSLDEGTGIYGNSVSYSNRLDIRFNRIKAPITFMDGAYFDGNGNPVEETPQAEAFRTTEEYYFEADVSSYNVDGEDYYTPPEKYGYTFAGWYADDACTIEYDFTTMPATGITVYAKWIQNQYRVFLHPNVPETDTTLNWGSADQDMNFRISSGNKVSAPTGTRAEYKFIGWYLDEACTQVFDADRFILNDTSVTTPYDKTVDMTDEMNKYGNIVGTGTNSDLTGYNGKERFWITRKLDLYAKWRAELIGADGIGVKYDANGGSNAPDDTTLYMDNTNVVAQGASTPPDSKQQFLYWVLQAWDEEQGKYIDIEGEDNKYYPGKPFTVLKSNAKIEKLEGSTEEDPKYRYTVQLRAEYGPADEPTPTHLTWYANGGVSADGSTDQYTDPNLQINEADNIRPANTFVREGYTFLGWARIDSTTDGYEIAPRDLTEADLFLKYENGKFLAQITDGSEEWSEVTQVAADEKNPYHDMYAVWEKKTYTVTVIKMVTGLSDDNNIPFSFTPSFSGLSGSEYTSAFQLVGNVEGADVEYGGETVHYAHSKEFLNVPYDTAFSITEQLGTDNTFAVTVSYTVSDADKEEDNKTVVQAANGTEIIAKGNVEITVTNERKIRPVKIQKVSSLDNTPLNGAQFKVNVGGTEYLLTSDEDGFLKNDAFPDGMLMIPYGTYSLKEVAPPNGYSLLSSDVSVQISENGVIVEPSSCEVTEPSEEDEFYTITIPNTPGVPLPATGGEGVTGLYLLGMMLIAGAGLLLFFKRKRIL